MNYEEEQAIFFLESKGYTVYKTSNYMNTFGMYTGAPHDPAKCDPGYIGNFPCSCYHNIPIVSS